MKENDTQTVVDFVDKVLMNIDDEKTIVSVKNDVKEFMKGFVLYPELVWEFGVVLKKTENENSIIFGDLKGWFIKH